MNFNKDNMDGRKIYDWETRYTKPIRLEFYLEGLYLFFLLISVNIIIFLTWNGWIGSILKIPPNKMQTFIKYSYYASSGMLGGLTFDIKHLYRSVARGVWSQDRKLWRLLSPFIAMSVAFIIGAMIDSNLITFIEKSNSATFISIGFLSGYFADRAVGKMSEIAKVLFGENPDGEKLDTQSKKIKPVEK